MTPGHPSTKCFKTQHVYLTRPIINALVLTRSHINMLLHDLLGGWLSKVEVNLSPPFPTFSILLTNGNCLEMVSEI